MAVKNNKLAKIANQLFEIQKELAKTNNELQAIAGAIEKVKTDEKTNASNTNFNEQLSESIVGLQLIDAEQNKLQAKFEAIQANKEESVLQILKHKLQHFGCTLHLSHEADKTLYKFDFGQGRCIITSVVDSHLSLVQICPESTQFAETKAFLDESQDLVGMLAIFADIYSTTV